MERREGQIRRELAFWRWVWSSGLRTLLDRWLFAHLAVGAALATAIPTKMSEVASTAFLPLASILVGLSFAWAGNALAVLQTPELRRVTTARGAPGYSAYLFTFQLAVLIILVTLVTWGLLALGLANSVEALYRHGPARLLGRTAAFALTSVSIRECWQVILATQSGLIVRHLVKTEQERVEAGRGSTGDDADAEAESGKRELASERHSHSVPTPGGPSGAERTR